VALASGALASVSTLASEAASGVASGLGGGGEHARIVSETADKPSSESELAVDRKQKEERRA
jgi:hypothetical protein